MAAEKSRMHSQKKSPVSDEVGQPETMQDKFLIWLVAIAMLLLGSIVDRDDS
jgi:hypothetical protein